MFSMQRLEEKTPTVALLDVDDTLIIGSYIIDPERDNVAKIKGILRGHGVLNKDLMNALKAANIKDIYLFTDMTLNSMGLLERQALVEILKEEGFIVHGVMTPADCAWHLPTAPLQAFAESKEALLPKKIDDLKKAGKTEEAAQLLSTFKPNADCQQLITASELKGAGKPGIAFDESEKAMQDSKEALQKCTSKSQHGKPFADFQAVLEGMSHLKGKMFQYFINHNRGRFKKIVVCDDRLDVLESIEQANNIHPEPVDAVTVYINNNGKKKSPGEQVKNYVSYLNAVKASAVLNNACSVYKAHLENFISGERRNNNGDEKRCETDENFVLAKKKLAAVNEMHSQLGKTIGEKQLKAFLAKFIEHRATLEQRRCSWSSWFLKVTATVFSLGIAAAFGIWNVTGREMTKTIEPFLPRPRVG